MEGWHFEPLPPEPAVTLVCAANSLWVDATLGGVRRCVQDRPGCPWPLVDAGLVECSEPEPAVLSVDVVNADFYYNEFARQRDASSVVDVPFSPHYHHDLQLIVRGQFLTEPVTVTVGAIPCVDAQLLNVTRHCSVDASGRQRCVEYGTSVMCVMANNFGQQMGVVLTTGRGPRRRSISSLPVPSGAFDVSPITVSFAEPYINNVGNDWDSPNFVHVTWVQIVDVRIDRTFPLQICTRGQRRWQEGRRGYNPVVRLQGELIECEDAWRSWQHYYCPYQFSVECYYERICTFCTPTPRPGEKNLLLTVELTPPSGVGLMTNRLQSVDPEAAATISYQNCPTGTFLNHSEPLYYKSCVSCPAGSFANSTFSVQSCTSCPAGSYAPSNGSGSCLPCPAGSVAREAGRSSCTACTGNRWQRFEGQTECNECDAGKYLLHVNDSTALPVCAPCPDGAE